MSTVIQLRVPTWLGMGLVLFRLDILQVLMVSKDKESVQHCQASHTIS